MIFFYSRIYELLPAKIQQWQSGPCISEENNRRSLEKIRRQQLETRKRIGELDLKHQELDAIVERAKHATSSQEDVGFYSFYNFLVHSHRS